MTVPFILASASPRRLDLMRQLGYEFRVIPSEATELHTNELSPGELAQINAYRKARAVAQNNPEAIVIGMDTLVALEGRVFGKPATRKHAREMLEELSGRRHVVVTGVSLVHLKARRKRVFGELTQVVFRRLTRDDINAYHAKVNPLDKAGAYGIQEHGEMIVESIEGSFSNVVGFPVERVRTELRDFLELEP